MPVTILTSMKQASSSMSSPSSPSRGRRSSKLRSTATAFSLPVPPGEERRDGLEREFRPDNDKASQRRGMRDLSRFGDEG